MQLTNDAEKIIRSEGIRIGVAVSRFNQSITDSLLQAAMGKLSACTVAVNSQDIISVPGAIEIPYALDRLALSGKYDALVALGCVIQGETPHFDYVCAMAQQGVLRVMLDYHIPIGFGILTTHDQKQAEQRIHVAQDAVLAALELAALGSGKHASVSLSS